MIYEIDSPLRIGYPLRVNLVYVLIRASFKHQRHLKSSHLTSIYALASYL